MGLAREGIPKEATEKALCLWPPILPPSQMGPQAGPRQWISLLGGVGTGVGGPAGILALDHVWGVSNLTKGAF